jgi:hypothetical protein
MIQPIQFLIADSFTDSLYQPNGNEQFELNLEIRTITFELSRC